MMYYYLADTCKGIQAIKTKNPIQNKEAARQIVGGPVSWYSPVNVITYYFNKTFQKKG